MTDGPAAARGPAGERRFGGHEVSQLPTRFREVAEGCEGDLASRDGAGLELRAVGADRKLEPS